MVRRGVGLWIPTAEGPEAESRLSRTRRQAPPAESERNGQPTQVQTSTGPPHSPLSPEEAGDPERAAQKEKLHAELKRVLQRKGASQPSSEEAEEEEEEEPRATAGVAVQLRKMEKTTETSELLEIIVETEAEAGVSGMSVAGGGKQGLFVKDVLKGSPAARALSFREGDQLLSARVYFDNMKYEDALQILKSAEPYKVSFCLKRTVPSTNVTRSPGAPAFEVRGPKAKMAKLSMQSLTSLRKKKLKKAGKGLAKDMQEAEARGSRELVSSKPEGAPVDVEFSLPKLSKLRKARSAGEVAAAARPSPDLSPLLSSLETKRRRLKLPRLKVKEALAARAAGAAAPPKAAPAQKAAARGGAGGKASRFTVPFSKGKLPKEEAAAGFQAPEVELDFSLLKVGPSRASPEASAGHDRVPPFGLPKVEMALPKGGLAGPEAPVEGSWAGLRLPTAEVAAPKVDVGLSLPGRDEAALGGEGFQIKGPKSGVSVEETERKPALLEVVLGKGRGKAEGPGEKVAMPPLEVGLPPIGVEIPLPRGKVEAEVTKPRMEFPDVSLTLPTVGLPRLGSKPQEEEEEESRVPQVELSVGKPESPKAKAKSQTPGFGISVEHKPESRGAAAAGPAESKGLKALGLKVPSLDISAPRVSDMQLPKALGGLAAPALLAKAEEVVEGPRFKLQVPHVSLSTSSTPAKATPSPPQAPKRPEGEAGVKAGIPALDLSLPAVKSLEVQLPKGPLPKPELGLCVGRPEVEVALPAARLSFPAAPALELDVPTVGVELGLPKVDGKSMGPEPPPRDHEAKLKMPTLEALSKDLGVEIRIPKCREEQPEPRPGVEASAGPEVGALVARIPTVDLVFSKEDVAEAGLVRKQAPGLEGPAKGGEMKLPSVEVSAAKFPPVATERGQSPEREAKLKSPRFALPKFGISGPKARRVSAESPSAAADGGSKLKMPKFGLSFPKSKGGADAEGPQPALGAGRRSADEEARMKPPSVVLPKVDVEVPKLGIGLPTGKAELPDEEGTGTLPELSIGLPDIQRKMPKFALPKLGGKGKGGDVELETGEALAGERGAKSPEKEARPKASKFKMALLSMAGRDLEGAGPGGESTARAGAGSPLVKMPQLKLPTPKAEQVPQVELPRIGLPGARVEEALLTGSESPSLGVKVPVLEIALPGAATTAEPTTGRPPAEAAGAERRSYEAELKIPQAPSLGVSAPQVELALRLPTAGAEPPLPPQGERPAFGKGEAAAGGQGLAGASKTRVPRVGLSVPTAWLPEAELPWTEGERAAAGPEGQLRMPSVELPKFPAPKGRAPEQEPEGGTIRPAVKLSSPAARLPKARSSSLEGEGEAEMHLPQLELKVPKLGGSAERPGTEAGGREGRAPAPCPSSSFGLCQAAGEAGAAEEVAALGPDSKFKLKIPSVSLSKAGTEPRADTQPFCPSPEEEGGPFRMPQISLPEVGFSVGQGGTREAKVEAGKLASVEGLEAEGVEVRLKMPKIKVPARGASVPKGGRDGPEGKRAALRVPGLELSAPTLKAHAEYQVEGAQLQRRGSLELETAGRTGRGEAAETGKKYKVKIPKIGLSLPKAGEGVPGQEVEAKGKRPTFVLGRPKGRRAEGSSRLLEGEEAAGGGGVMGRFRLGLSRLKTGPEVNGELEEGSAWVQLPQVGFSEGEGAPLNGEPVEAALQNGTQDGKGKAGKIRLPQVELSSPAAAAEGDPELRLQLVSAEAAPGGAGTLAALRFKPPKITFSGFKKRNGEPAPGAMVASAARTEMASLERGDVALKGERPPKFKFPRVALSPTAPSALGITSKEQPSPEEARRGSQEGLKIQLPRVGFSEEAGGSPPAAKGTGAARAAV